MLLEYKILRPQGRTNSKKPQNLFRVDIGLIPAGPAVILANFLEADLYTNQHHGHGSCVMQSWASCIATKTGQDPKRHGHQVYHNGWQQKCNLEPSMVSLGIPTGFGRRPATNGGTVYQDHSIILHD